MSDLIADNPKAYFSYEIVEKYVAGIALDGGEVKSIKARHISIKESHVKVIGGEVWLGNANVTPYAYTHDRSIDPTRSRKLLLHKSEINRLIGKVKERGYSIVPLKMFLIRGLIKVEIGLGKGKTNADKRNTIKEKEAKRDMARDSKIYR